MKKVLVIIPAYNESQSIESVVLDIKKNAKNVDYVIINDASTDDTEMLCKQKNFNVITLPCNLGIGGAMQTGFKYAKMHGYDAAVQMDGDGQHSAEYVHSAIEKMQSTGADIVIGSRFRKANNGFKSSALRRIGIRYFSFLIFLLTGRKVTDPTSGFRLVNKKVIEQFARDYPADYPEPETIVLLLKNKFKVAEVPVEMCEREHGESSITPFKSIYYAIKVTLAMIFARNEAV